MITLKFPQGETKEFDTNNNYLAIVGDWHGDTFYAMKMLRALNELNIKIVISVGDFGYWSHDATYLAQMSKFMKKNNMILIFADGNHEDHQKLNAYPINSTTGCHHIRKNILHIPRGHYFDTYNDQDYNEDGTVKMGRWLALGGAASVDREYRREGIDWFQEEYITNEDVEKAISHGKVNVMITHDAPITKTLKNRYMAPSMWPIEDLARSDQNQKKVQTVMEKTRPEFLYHGHHHYSYNEYIKETNTYVIGLDCNGTKLHANLMIADIMGNPQLEYKEKISKFE